jgi:hypothetical protein
MPAVDRAADDGRGPAVLRAVPVPAVGVQLVSQSGRRHTAVVLHREAWCALELLRCGAVPGPAAAVPSATAHQPAAAPAVATRPATAPIAAQPTSFPAATASAAARAVPTARSAQAEATAAAAAAAAAAVTQGGVLSRGD